MAKLTKKEIANHNKILDLIHSDKVLNFDEKYFILENYHEGATNINSAAGAFFTPILYSRDFALEVFGNTVVDLCAGIGSLSFYVMNTYNPEDRPERLVCVELNPEYYEIGKRIIPEAEWILMDALEYQPDMKFEQSISNPPFGKIKTSTANDLLYTGSEFEYKIIAKAKEISSYGTFILPQGSAGFKYSGNCNYMRAENNKYQKYHKEVGTELVPGIGIDSSVYTDQWKGVKVITEVCVADFDGIMN